MIDVPGETLTDIKKTEKIIEEIRPDYFDVFFAIPYPGTELYNLWRTMSLPIRNVPYDQLIVEELRKPRSPIICANFTEEELVEIRNRLISKRPELSFRTILQQPCFIPRGFHILTKGFSGTLPGLKRFLTSGKINFLTDEIYRAYLDKEQPRLQ